jgi:hypothetical protein
VRRIVKKASKGKNGFARWLLLDAPAPDGWRLISGAWPLTACGRLAAIVSGERV